VKRQTNEFKTEFTVDGAETVAVAAIHLSMRGVDLDHPASADVLAHDVMQALDAAGFSVVRKPQPGSTTADRVEFARRTGCWDGVSHRDYLDWVQSLVLSASGSGFMPGALEPGRSVDVPRGKGITTVEAPVVTRDLVLFNCEDYEGNSAAAEALGLDSYPLEDAVTLGWLVDEHAAFKQTIETLFWDLTNGCVSKPSTSLDVVHELAGKAFIVNLLEEHPELAEDPLFRPAMEQHLDVREISAAVEIAQLRRDGNRVVRVGTLGTFNLGKATA